MTRTSGLVRRQVEAGQPFGWESLTSAQRGIAELVATGLTNREIATRLYLSRHTVGSHLRQIFNKLGIGSRVQLAGIVVEHRACREN
jgi:DNA-binding NarL/FixJ family response regulator